MAWGKPFEPVEKLPVPPEVGEAFRKVRAKEAGRGLSSNAGRAIRQKAQDALEMAESDAAKHFGGDVGKMRKHLGRWLRSKGAHMSISPGDIIPREAIDRGMESVREEYLRGIPKQARIKPTRRPQA